MIIIIVVSIITFLFFLLGWTVHLSIMNGQSRDFGWGSFNDFKREYNKRVWQRDNKYRRSHFGVGDCYSSNYIHAGIIRFNNVGMKLDFKSHVLFTFWVVKNRLKRTNMKFNNIVSEGDC